MDARRLYSLVDIDDVEPCELEDAAPTLLPIGLELQPENMRPSVWEYDRGEENTDHRQGEQEERYVVLEGTVDVTIEREREVDGNGDRERKRDRIELTSGDVLVVPPKSWRQLEAIEKSPVLVVGPPNVKADAILEERASR